MTWIVPVSSQHLGRPVLNAARRPGLCSPCSSEIERSSALLKLVVSLFVGWVLLVGGTGWSLSSSGSPRAEVLRDSSRRIPMPPRAADLLAGRACKPLSELLRNRPIPAVHSYARDIVCT